MKSKLIPVITVIILILLAVAGYVFYKNNKSSSMMEKISQTNKNSSVFTSIQDALSKSLSLSCDYTDKNGIHTIAYLKNGAIRADITGTSADSSGSVIVKDKKIYFWNSKGAYVMDEPEITVTPNPTDMATSQNGSMSTSENLMPTLEAYKKYCKVAVVADNLFTPPANVKFMNMNEIMQPSLMPTSMMQEGKSAIPTNYQQYLNQKTGNP